VWVERAQIKHPVKLSPQEQEKLASGFVKEMFLARKSGDENRRIIAYLKYAPWQQELAEATEGRKTHAWRMPSSYGAHAGSLWKKGWNRRGHCAF
jgi:hypothetical protein